jgi:hypothetical protein
MFAFIRHPQRWSTGTYYHINVSEYVSSDCPPVLTLTFRSQRYVRVTGAIKQFNRFNFLVFTNVEVVRDPHEIYFHLSDVMLTEVVLEKGSPSVRIFQWIRHLASVNWICQYSRRFRPLFLERELISRCSPAYLGRANGIILMKQRMIIR